MLENHHNKVVGSNPSTNTTKIHNFIKKSLPRKYLNPSSLRASMYLNALIIIFSRFSRQKKMCCAVSQAKCNNLIALHHANFFVATLSDISSRS